MKKQNSKTLIIIIGQDVDDYLSLITMLEENQYQGIILKTLKTLKEYLSENECMAVIIDIDSVKVQNREIRKLKLTFPQNTFLFMSCTSYHPELKESICYYLYACMKKPVCSDELFYLLRCIKDDKKKKNDLLF